GADDVGSTGQTAMSLEFDGGVAIFDGTLEWSGDLDTFKFDARAGSGYVATSSQRQVFNADNSAGLASLKAESAGPQFVTVSPRQTEFPAPYHLVLTDLGDDFPDNPQSAQPGPAGVSGRIEVAGDRDYV